MTVEQHYLAAMRWQHSEGTGAFHAYPRDHQMFFEGKPTPLPGSSPAYYRGDVTKYNSGELLVAAIAQSHMLRFLEVASEVGLTVVEYADHAVGTITMAARGDGAVGAVSLRPGVTVRSGPLANERDVMKFHDRALEISIIANTIVCPIEIHPEPLVVID